mgnify:FL=1
MPHIWSRNYWMEFAIRFWKFCIHSLTLLAVLNKFSDVLVNISPKKTTRNLLNCFVSAQMAPYSGNPCMGHWQVIKVLPTYLLFQNGMTLVSAFVHQLIARKSSTVMPRQYQLSCIRFQFQTWNSYICVWNSPFRLLKTLWDIGCFSSMLPQLRTHRPPS